MHCILYVLFENAMGVVKLWAVVAGALNGLTLLKSVSSPWYKRTNVLSTHCSRVCVLVSAASQAGPDTFDSLISCVVWPHFLELRGSAGNETRMQAFVRSTWGL